MFVRGKEIVMKNLIKSLVAVFLIFSLCVPALAEVLVQPAAPGIEITTIKPYNDHPRILIRPDEISSLKANLTKEQN